MNRFRRLASEILLIAASLLVGYVILEAGYRYYTYQVLPGKLFETVSGQVPANYQPEDFQRVFDLDVGWGYPPNSHGTRGAPWFSEWKTNSHGHVSDDEYPVEKPSGEYRIGVLGDSFTANITNTIRWTALLEKKLNNSETWRKRVGGKYIRVINFGIDGLGVEQMAKVAEFRARPFDVDFLIVNFIADDILRKLFHHGNANFKDAADRERAIRDYVFNRYLLDFDWFVFRPELVAATVGKWVGLKPSLPSVKTASNLLTAERVYERQDAIDVSVKSFRRIDTLYDNTLYLLNPSYEDLAGVKAPLWNWLVEDVASAIPEIEFIDMSHYLDLPDSVQAVEKWFYVPTDKHYSDYGLVKYADAVFEFLTTDYLNPGAAAARNAVVSSDTVAAGRVGRKQVGGFIAKPGDRPVPVPVVEPEKTAPLIPPKTLAGPVAGQRIDRFEDHYETHVTVTNSVAADGAAPDDTAAGILGWQIRPRHAGNVIRVAVTVPGYASLQTDMVVGLYYNGARTAAQFAAAHIEAGDVGAVSLEHYFSVSDLRKIDLTVRVGVGAGGRIVFNGDDDGPGDRVSQPRLIVEEIVPDP